MQPRVCHINDKIGNVEVTLFLFGICLIASIIGAVCGIGGGIIIKPVMDAFGLMDVSTVSFLSACTVLSMTAYSVLREKTKAGSALNMRQLLPVSLGAAAGGLIGKMLFQSIARGFPNAVAGLVQSACLLVVVAGTFVYTFYEDRVHTLRLESDWVRVLVGFALGALSSFLGIGGGPFNLVALSYFFSMRGRDAVVSSLFIILISQIASVAMQVVTGSVPEFTWIVLIVMACGGVAGGIVGRKLGERVDLRLGRILFLGLNALIFLICVWNIAGYLRQIV